MCILQTRQLKPIKIKQGAPSRAAEEDLSLVRLVQSLWVTDALQITVMMLGSQMTCDLHPPSLGSSPRLQSNISIQWHKETGRAGIPGGKGLEWKERRQKS